MANKELNKLEKKCLECGTVFITSKAIKRQKKFCKHICGLRYNARLRKNKTYEELYGKERAEAIKAKSSKSHIGQHNSIETQFKKGILPWNKGKKHTNKTREKISLSNLGHKSNRKGKSLEQEYGIKKAEEIKEKNSKAHIGQIGWNKGKTYLEDSRISGRENHWNWKGGITVMNKAIRNSPKYIRWRKDIFERDNYTCQECGNNSGGDLNAHHLNSLHVILKCNNILNMNQALNCKEIWDLDNGITTCEVCHNELHSVGGY